MNRLLTAVAASFALAGAAQAAEVSVSIGPELQRHARSYGSQDVERLRDDLQKTMEKAIAKAGPQAPQKVQLVLESATPNRPTFKQLGDTTGLSMFSLGLGGAVITGQVTGADGTVRPIAYRWQEYSLENVLGYTTWTDAERAFDRLSTQVAKGEAPNNVRFRPDMASAAAFDSLRRFR